MKLEFTKTDNPNETKDFYWLTQATIKNDTTQYIATVLIKDGCAYKTDGMRLLSVENSYDNGTWPDGVYDTVKRTKSQMILIKRDDEPIWPDLDNVFQNTEHAWKSFIISSKYIETGIKDIMVALADSESTINCRWLYDIIDGVFDCHIMDEEGNKPITFTNGNRTALVMPMRVNR